jgi:hypothetical protein
VQLQELLESPLLGADGAKWKQEPRQQPEEFLQWEDAQITSLKASEQVDTFKDLLVPLSNTKQKHVLETVWKYINLVSHFLLN